MPIFPRVRLGSSLTRLRLDPQLKNDLNSNGDYIIFPVGIARRDFRGYLSLHSSSAGLNEISMNNLRLRINFFFEISLPRWMLW